MSLYEIHKILRYVNPVKNRELMDLKVQYRSLGPYYTMLYLPVGEMILILLKSEGKSNDN